VCDRGPENRGSSVFPIQVTGVLVTRHFYKRHDVRLTHRLSEASFQPDFEVFKKVNVPADKVHLRFPVCFWGGLGAALVIAELQTLLVRNGCEWTVRNKKRACALVALA
jgi:hypothetical protein